MKKRFTKGLFFTLGLVFMLLGGSNFMYADETIRYTVSFSPDDLQSETKTENDIQFLILDHDGSCYYGEPGEPNIPYFIIRFAVPANSYDHAVSFSNIRKREAVALQHPIYPVQIPQTINDYDPELFISTVDTDNCTWFPMEGKLMDDIIVNGKQRVVSVGVPMAEVSAVCDSYEPIEQIDLVLTYKLGNEMPDWFTLTDAPASPLDIPLESFVVNYDSKKRVTVAESASGNVQERLIIVTPQYLKDAMQPIVHWKRQLGYATDIYAYEDILPQQGGSYRDPEEELREWLKLKYQALGTFHLFIIGDETAGAPIRKFYTNPSWPEDLNDYKLNYRGDYFLPTDGYFSDVSSNFELFPYPNGYYSAYLYNQTVSPQLPVGRLLVSKMEDISTYSDKLRIYELDPGIGDSAYLNRGMAFFQKDCLHEASLLPSLDGLTLKTMMRDKYTTSNPTFSPTGKEVINIMKECGIASMHGHGSPLTIRTSGPEAGYQNHPYILSIDTYGGDITGHLYNDEDHSFSNLDNPYKPFFGYSISCDVCPFDLYRQAGRVYPEGLYNLGAAFTVAGKFGGIAFVGNTRAGYLTLSDYLEQEFGKEINRNGSLGVAVLKSSVVYSSYKKANFSRCLIGDPTIKIWNGAPASTSTLSIANGYINVHSDNYENCSVSVYDGQSNPITLKYQAGNSFQFKISDLIKNMGNDFMISLIEPQQLPQVRLIASNSVISNTHKSYTLRDGLVTNILNEKLPCFIVKAKGGVDIMSIRGMQTKNTFNIENGGVVNLKAIKGVISLSEDKAKSGGELNITSSGMTLDKGFTMEKGGRLNCILLK